MRISMHETPSFGLELPRSFLRDWVAAVRGVGIPGNLEPGQAEACPHTAAMTSQQAQKKAPAVMMGRLVRAPSLPAGSYTWPQVLLRLGEFIARADWFAMVAGEGNFRKLRGRLLGARASNRQAVPSLSGKALHKSHHARMTLFQSISWPAASSSRPSACFQPSFSIDSQTTPAKSLGISTVPRLRAHTLARPKRPKK